MCKTYVLQAYDIHMHCIIYMFPLLDLRLTSFLLTMFVRLTCLVYYIACLLSFCLAIQLMKAYDSSRYSRLFLLLLLGATCYNYYTFSLMLFLFSIIYMAQGLTYTIIQELSQMCYQYRMVYPREVYWGHFFLYFY